jgi:hypothetical protein
MALVSLLMAATFSEMLTNENILNLSKATLRVSLLTLHSPNHPFATSTTMLAHQFQAIDIFLSF